jgi:anaerobic selenocysteine-containing dehydrogenase
MQDETKIYKTTTWSAGPGCHGGCGVLAYIKNGKLVKIEGDPDHPMNRGRLCSRCLAMTQYAYNPKRLRHPLKRVGERGENKWQEISWDEAFDLIEQKFGAIRDTYRPESVVFAMGTGRDVGAWICMLAYAFGSPNVSFIMSGNGCYTPRMVASEIVTGEYCMFDGGQWLPQGHEDPKYKTPECIVIWGYNIPASCPDNIFGHWVIDLMKKGTKIITIDPRLTWFASRSTKWLPLRPGTDGALAMAFLNIIIKENLYDKEFVKKWTNAPHLIRKDTFKLLHESDLDVKGSPDNFVVWDTNKAAPAVWVPKDVEFKTTDVKPALEGEFKVCLADGKEVTVTTVWSEFCRNAAEYPVDKVAKITWLKEEDIIEAARLYAKSKPAVIQWGLAIDATPAITPTATAIADLWSITGNMDTPGGNVIARYAFNAVAYALPGAKGVIKLASKEMDEDRIGANEYGPFRQFIWRSQTDMTLDAIITGKPYPVKGMWFQCCNLIGGIGYDTKKWVEALNKLDFIVTVDLFMTPTAQMSDVVLPASTFLEKESIRSWWVPLQSINKIMSVDDCKSDIEINFELSKRFDKNFQWKTVHELFDDILKPSGLTFEQLQEKGWVIPPDGDPSAPYHRFERGLLRPDKKPGFNTTSGKVELYSTLREKWQFEAMPFYEEPPFTPISRPDLAKDYPLILSTGRRSPVYFLSEHRNIPWLRDADPDPVVEIHPDTAASLGIGNGEWVWVENWQGKCKLKAKVTPIVPRWMVMAAHGWWSPPEDGIKPDLDKQLESNINYLMPMGSQGKDGLGSPTKHLLCRVYKVSG